MKKSLKNKNYCRLLGTIGKSKEALSTSEIIRGLKNTYPSSDWNYVYEMLDELCPSRYFTFKERMFCVSDLVSEDSDLRKKSSIRLGDRLKKHHPPLYYLEQDDLTFFETEAKTHVEKDTNGRVTKVIIEDDHNNSIVIEGTLQQPEIISSQSIMMTVTYAPKSLTKAQIPKSVFSLASKKKGGKVYAHQVALKMGNPAPLQYLNVQSDGEFKKYRLNFRGLVLFLLSEDNIVVINAVLKNLSEIDRDLELKQDTNGLSYSIKENFPFLCNYFTEFQSAIHSDFVPSRLKDVVKEIENKLDFIEMKELKYYVTRKFYAYIQNYEFRNDALFYTQLKIPLGLTIDPTHISIYKLSILYYIRKNIEEELSLVDKMIQTNEENIGVRSSVI